MKRICILAALLAIVLFAAGCQRTPTANEDNTVIQLLADKSHLAQEHAAPLFAAHMAEQGFDNYAIDRTSSGFYTSDTPDSVYVVGYIYSANGESGMYGYKIHVDENEICSVLEEGVDVARFLFST